MLIYFSGTGNSQSVAQKLAAKLSDTAVPLIKLMEEPEQYALEKEASIGVVFPVYFGDMPEPVSSFITKASLNPSTYFYGVATCGGSGGIALHHLQELLKAKGCKLYYGKVITMIANSTATWKSEVKYDFHRLDKELPAVEAIAKAVQNKSQDDSELGTSLLGKFFACDFIKTWGQKRFAISVDASACVGCGLCTRLCPNHNLQLLDGKAVFGSGCAYCMACVHSCPHGGILVNGHTIKKENQYAHPDLSLKERMLR